MKPFFVIEHCSSCGLELNSHMTKAKDYYIETDADGDYYICSVCKAYWDKVEN